MGCTLISDDVAEGHVVLSHWFWQQRFDGDPGLRGTVVPLAAEIFKPYVDNLLILFGAVGFVLLVGGSNVATLLMARGVTRHKELATRAALGASRFRLVRQLVTESLLLSLAGGLLGILMTVVGVRVFEALQPDIQLPWRYYPLDIHIGRVVLAFALGLSMLTGLIFGVGDPASRQVLRAAAGTHARVARRSVGGLDEPAPV